MERALLQWEEKLRPFIASMQLDALKMRQIFTPSGEAQRVLRSATIRLMTHPLTGPIVRRMFADNKAKIADLVAQ